MGAWTDPANFTLVAAANPCPCGNFGDPGRPCTCEARSLDAYRSRLSGSVRDRIDMIVNVPRQGFAALFGESSREEASAVVRRRVDAARACQRRRGSRLNAAVERPRVSSACGLGPAASRQLAAAGDRLHLSARGFHRVLRVARTIADLAGEEHVGPTRYRPDDDALVAAPTRIVIAVEEESTGTLTGRTSPATAELVGQQCDGPSQSSRGLSGRRLWIRRPARSLRPQAAGGPHPSPSEACER